MLRPTPPDLLSKSGGVGESLQDLMNVIFPALRISHPMRKEIIANSRLERCVLIIQFADWSSLSPGFFEITQHTEGHSAFVPFSKWMA
jgi:hypothetical protein